MTGRGDSRVRIQLRQLGVIMLAVCTVTPVFNVLTSAPTLRSAVQGVRGKEAPVAAYSLSG